MQNTHIRRLLRDAVRRLSYARDTGDRSTAAICCKFINENWHKRNRRIAAV